MNALFEIGLIAMIVTVDNALLAGLLLPPALSHERKRSVLIILAFLLAISQVLLAASVGQLLHNILFRLFAIGLLGWMCIRTLGMSASRSVETSTAIAKLWLFTLVGNLDNMFWLGSELEEAHFALLIVSFATIPLFVAVALLLSDQSEKQKWIAPLGAGMMAWTAASLTLDTPIIQSLIYNLDESPRTTIQCLITILILVVGLGVRKMLHAKCMRS
jgi:hypothetical protein